MGVWWRRRSPWARRSRWRRCRSGCRCKRLPLPWERAGERVGWNAAARRRSSTQEGRLMEFDDQQASSNVEDRRGMGPVGIGGLGLGGIAILVIGYFLGVDPSQLLGLAEQVSQPSQTAPAPREGPVTDPMGHFVAQVLGSTESVWTQVFEQSGREYEKPHLVLYDGSTPSACGMGRAAMGPFYCPSDERVYLDLSFFRDLATRFHAPGNFPEAYVVAHEVGHHVQNQLGITQKVDRMRGHVSRAQMNQLSVRVELQADCF